MNSILRTTLKVVFVSSLAQVEGGVVVAPLVLGGALVVTAVRLVGFLKNAKYRWVS